jgi:PAS domain S-box-containing protein
MIAHAPERTPAATDDGHSDRSLGADIIIANAPHPVFVSDLEGKILQANDAVSRLLGFRRDELIDQSLSQFISPEETSEFTAALREVDARGVTRDARLNPRSASDETIPTTLNASALRDADGRVIGAQGLEAAQAGGLDLVLMDMSLPVLDGWEATRQFRVDPRPGTSR